MKKNKVDHPPTGSKDCSDAMAGVVCGLSRQREIWVRHNISLHRMPASLSGDKEREAKKDEARSLYEPRSQGPRRHGDHR